MMKKHIKPQTLTLQVTPCNLPTPLLKLQIGGYLQYLDAQHVALKPICRLLGWDYKDAVARLLDPQEHTPSHRLFAYGRFVYQSTWGVQFEDMADWLSDELPNFDSHDKAYACLLALQMFANAGQNNSTPTISRFIAACVKAVRQIEDGFRADVRDYLAENFTEAYHKVMATTLAEAYSDAT